MITGEKRGRKSNISIIEKLYFALRKTALSSAKTVRLRGLRCFLPRSRIRDIFGVRKQLLASRLTAHDSIYGQKLSGEEKLSQELHSQRTFPPSGRVTTLVPRPFFFRRAFITIEFKIKHKNNSTVKELDTEIGEGSAGTDESSDF